MPNLIINFCREIISDSVNNNWLVVRFQNHRCTSITMFFSNWHAFFKIVDKESACFIYGKCSIFRMISMWLDFNLCVLKNEYCDRHENEKFNHSVLAYKNQCHQNNITWNTTTLVHMCRRIPVKQLLRFFLP